jgi:hypothetical protein
MRPVNCIETAVCGAIPIPPRGVKVILLPDIDISHSTSKCDIRREHDEGVAVVWYDSVPGKLTYKAFPESVDEHKSIQQPAKSSRRNTGDMDNAILRDEGSVFLRVAAQSDSPTVYLTHVVGQQAAWKCVFLRL